MPLGHIDTYVDPRSKKGVSPVLLYSQDMFFLEFQVLSGGNVKKFKYCPTRSRIKQH